MVKWFSDSPFHAIWGARDDGAVSLSASRAVSVKPDPAMVAAQHERSMALLRVIMQVDTFLAGFMLFALTGQKETTSLDPEEKLQVILQTVTFGVFLAAIVHTAVLMMSTGWKYALSWSDPIPPGMASALGLCLLLVTVADAVFLELRPETDLTDPEYWYIVICGLLLPVLLAGLVATIQMTNVSS